MNVNEQHPEPTVREAKGQNKNNSIDFAPLGRCYYYYQYTERCPVR